MQQRFKQNPKHYLTKPYFKDYYHFLIQRIKRKKFKKILDIGCASGHFFYYLPKKINGLGVDISAPLIRAAKKSNSNKNINFKKLNLFLDNKKKLNFIIKKNKLMRYDLITMLGTISTFPNYKDVIKVLSKLKPKEIILQTPLNPENFDVTISHKKDIGGKEMVAYHIFALKNLENVLRSYNYRVKVIKYSIKKNLKKNKKDPIRNYHLHLKNGKKILTNGICCLLQEFIIIASKK